MATTEQNQKLNKLIEATYTAIRETEAYADLIGETFSLSLTYGMGGTYFPKIAFTKAEALRKIKANEPFSASERKLLADVLNGDMDSEIWDASQSGWHSSSANC